MLETLAAVTNRLLELLKNTTRMRRSEMDQGKSRGGSMRLLQASTSSARLSEYNGSVSVVIPTLNEGESIGHVVTGLRRQLPNSHSIIVVDGGSLDGTTRKAKTNGAVVIRQKGKGYGDALVTGFKYAEKEFGSPFCVMIDGDGTYDPSDLRRLLAPIFDGSADLVVGNRFADMESGAMKISHKIGNKLLCLAIRVIFGLPLHDTQSGLRAFKTKLVKEADYKEEGMPFATEMLIKAKRSGARVAEVPIKYRRRCGGTKMKILKDGPNILRTILELTGRT